jgi:SAM-dependent methyltransferase
MSRADPSGDPPQLAAWLRAAEERYLADLTFAEVTRALRALSSCYVERRGRLARGEALDGAGKRAAFALFYAALHALVTLRIVEALGARLRPRTTLLDLGCGTGSASGAWALAAGAPVIIDGVDRSAWAVREASWTWRTLGVRARATRGDVMRARAPRDPAAWLAAFTLNELQGDARGDLRERMVAAAAAGHAILIIEPLAGAVAPWWHDWADAFRRVGGRSDEWRFPGRLPDLVARFDRAAGLRHDELTARTIYVAQRENRGGAREARG